MQLAHSCTVTGISSLEWNDSLKWIFLYNASYRNILEERDYWVRSSTFSKLHLNTCRIYFAITSANLQQSCIMRARMERSQSSATSPSNCCVLEAWLADAFFSPDLANAAGWNMGMCVSVTVLSYRNVFKRAVSVSRVTSTTLRQLGQDGWRPTGELCHMMKDRSAQGEDSILPSRPLSPYTARGHTFSEN